ncbi:MAG: hypothetical protein DRQ97_01340 [Gammaproteobacteria bacterium]|nr:MAG: hypothetical protein DRQ97_01340 [Gammaproteobacteria bacterium]
MANIFKIPELGDGDIIGIVVAMVANIGDTVSCGDTLIEVETEKAILEVPAEIDGVIDAFLVSLDQEIKEGEDFISIKPLAATVAAEPARTDDSEPKQEESTAPSEVREDNSTITDNQPLAGDTGDRQSHNTTPPESSKQCLAAGPATRRLARELGVDLSELCSSGYHGRIDKTAVKAFAKKALSQKQVRSGISSTQALTLPPLPDLSAFGPITHQPMSAIQKATCRNVNHAATRIPHAWLQRRIDITELERGRRQHKTRLKSEDCTLTLSALLAKIIGLACAQHPIINSCMDEQNDKILFREHINVGIAVDTPRGLLVPVIDDISSKSVKDIARLISKLSEKARTGKLQPAEMKGGSITLSNLGGIGVSGLFPIVNWPEVAILGIGAGEWQPTYIGGDISAAPEPRLMMSLTLAFDHRVINGADGARFVDTIAELCENPFLVLVS